MPYQSELTQFIKQLKENDAGLEIRQKEGRASLWEPKLMDLDERERMLAHQLPQKAYHYAQEVGSNLKAKDLFDSSDLTN